MHRIAAAALSMSLFLLVAAEKHQTPAVQEGLASFYGKKFEGKETASGETFDKDELTAAHPSHPGGTVLSQAAAKRLAFADEGRARVRVEVVKKGGDPM